ncbi:MAG: 30S ribosomal protein S3 [Candidatus Aenigmatarchaeota archaeon]
MVVERKFIGEAIRKNKVHEYLAEEFSKAGFSHAEIARTPVAMRVTVWVQKPGIVIGRGGKTIDALTETLKTRFGLENPQLDVQEVQEPDLDAAIVARQIAAAIERGLNYKRVAQLTLQRVMQAGAAGVAVRIGGKLGGEVSRREKFSAGYLKWAGEPAEQLSKGYATARVKLGNIGIQVRILIEQPKDLVSMSKIMAQPQPEQKTEETK